MGQESSKNDEGIDKEGISKSNIEEDDTVSDGSGAGTRRAGHQNIQHENASSSASSTYSSLPFGNEGRSLPKPFTKSDDWNAKFLLGNIENLPSSARKLFSMGKLYLTGEQRKEREAGYQSLFQALPSHDAGCSQENDMPMPNGAECNFDLTENDESEQEQSSNPNPNPFLRHVKKMTNLFVPMQNTAPLTCAQTYVQWRAAHDLLSLYSLCLPTRNIIYVQPIDDFPRFVSSFILPTHPIKLTFFEMLQGFVQIFFSGMEVIIQPPVFVQDEGWRVRSRLHEKSCQKQYCVTDLYPCLQSVTPRDGRCIVGISWTDLYPDGFNFVLGEASHLHNAAVISFGRFETTSYDPEHHQDISKVDGELVWKLLKTISHEICHVFGFSHCPFFVCAMNESSSVSQALSQPLFLCPVCLRKLQRVCGFDILDRYRHLYKFLSNLEHQLGGCQSLQDAICWLSNCIEYLNSTITD